MSPAPAAAETVPERARTYAPSHPSLFTVQWAPGSYASSLAAVRAFRKGEVIATLEHATRTPVRLYSTVQCGPAPEDNIELNSDLLYVNHSCRPNVAFDISARDPAQWHARALREIRPGETLTFFYPSTEWDMAQGFDCKCGEQTCLGRISGAKYLSAAELGAAGRGFINAHILRLVADRDQATGAVVQKARL